MLDPKVAALNKPWSKVVKHWYLVQVTIALNSQKVPSSQEVPLFSLCKKYSLVNLSPWLSWHSIYVTKFIFQSSPFLCFLNFYSMTSLCAFGWLLYSELRRLESVTTALWLFINRHRDCLNNALSGGELLKKRVNACTLHLAVLWTSMCTCALTVIEAQVHTSLIPSSGNPVQLIIINTF